MPRKGPNDPFTPEEFKRVKKADWTKNHDNLCPEFIGDGRCACITLYFLRALATIEKLMKKKGK